MITGFVGAGLFLLPKLRKYIFELWFAIIILFQLGIVYMLPHSGEQLLPYAMGFSLPILAASVIAVWHPGWAISSSVISIASAFLAFTIWDFTVSKLDLISSGFFVCTISLIGIVGVILRYYTAKREYIATLSLEEMVNKDEVKNEIMEQMKHLMARTKHIIINSSSATNKSEFDLEKITRNIADIEDKIVKLDDEVTLSSQLSKEVSDFISKAVTLISSQSSSIDESSASIMGISSSIKNISSVYRDKVQTIVQLRESAISGNLEMQNTLNIIKKVTQSANIIIEMINIINDIAAKTNLLSMNAFIEASHAGQYGKGFSVVAQEIRKLAENTANNSLEITKSLKSVVNDMQVSEKSAQKTGDVLVEIAASTNEVADRMIEMDDNMQKLDQDSILINKVFAELLEKTGDVNLSAEEMQKKADQITLSINHLTNISSDTKKMTSEIRLSINDLYETVKQVSEIGDENKQTLSELVLLANKFDHKKKNMISSESNSTDL